MKILIIYLISGLFSGLFYMPVKREYAVAEIPEQLLENSVAVIRKHNETFKVESIDKAVRRVEHVVTILDENGDNFGVFNEWYDKLRTIGFISITIYDKDGNVFKKVKSHEIKDYSSFSSYSIFEDNRQKLFVPKIKSYPYTVSISYEQSYKGLFVYPSWQPSTGYDLSVEQSSFTVITPQDFKFRFKMSNLDIEPQISNDKGKTILTWEVEQLEAVESEEYSPYYFETTGVLYTAPSDFSIEGFKGNMDTWQNLGLWAYELLKDRGKISDDTFLEINQLVEGVSDKKEIVRLIYKYMQARTRYVSIQEGIGGWQPMTALQVDEDGYGDCKALSNYTMALLREVGIESYYTKVRAGRNAPAMRKDFVSNQSNHIILCVPLESDTIWLECTSQISPFGYIGNFTDKRHVLLVTPEGGKLVKTKTYNKEENQQVNNAILKFTDDQKSTVNIESSYRGLQYDNVSSLLRKSASEREKWLYTNTDIENFKILSFDIEQDQTACVVPSIKTSLSIEIANYGSITGDRLFIPLNLMNQMSYIPPRCKDRRTDVVLRFPFTDIDSISYTLPEGYVIESAPESKDIVSEFGQLSVKIDIQGSRINYVRRRVMKEGTFPAASYNDFRQFYIDMQKMDQCKIVLKKEGS